MKNKELENELLKLNVKINQLNIENRILEAELNENINGCFDIYNNEVYTDIRYYTLNTNLYNDYLNMYNNKYRFYSSYPYKRDFMPNTVLYRDENGILTASMVLDVLYFIINVFLINNKQLEKYKKFYLSFMIIYLFLTNKTPQQLLKEYKKFAVDVIKEISDKLAQSEKEKIYNNEIALFAKMLIEFDFI